MSIRKREWFADLPPIYQDFLLEYLCTLVSRQHWCEEGRLAAYDDIAHEVTRVLYEHGIHVRPEPDPFVVSNPTIIGKGPING